MFEKFGEFDSAEELNKAAEGFRNEGDMESLYALAEENGINKEDAEDYADGETDIFASCMMAAVGRIDVEEKTCKKEKMPMQVIFLMLRGMCADPDMQRAIMKKGKRAEKILDSMKEAAKKHKTGGMGMCCGTDKQLKDLIRTYYIQTEDDLSKKIESMYV